MTVFKTALLGCIISGVAAAGSPSWLQLIQHDRDEQQGRGQHEERGREQGEQRERQYGEERHERSYAGGYYGGYYGPYDGYYYYYGPGGNYYPSDGYLYSGGYYGGPYDGYAYGAPGIIGRVLSDLSRPGYAYYNDHDRKDLANARRDLERFNANWRRGHFDKGRLNSAIGHLDDLAKSDRLHPSERAMYARDRNELRAFRANRGQYAYMR